MWSNIVDHKTVSANIIVPQLRRTLANFGKRWRTAVWLAINFGHFSGRSVKFQRGLLPLTRPFFVICSAKAISILPDVDGKIIFSFSSFIVIKNRRKTMQPRVLLSYIWNVLLVSFIVKDRSKIRYFVDNRLRCSIEVNLCLICKYMEIPIVFKRVAAEAVFR